MELLLTVGAYLILVQISRYQQMECDESIAMTAARSIFDMPWNFKTFHCITLKVHTFSLEPRLYKSVCLRVGRSVHQSVGLSVGWLVRRFIRNANLWRAVTRRQTTYFVYTNLLFSVQQFFLHLCHQGGPGTSQKCRIASLQEGMSVGPSVYPRIKLKK